MDVTHAIINYFARRKVVDTLARYDLFYNIALIHIANTIIKDANQTQEVLEKINLQINPELVFETMYGVVTEYHDDEELFTIFEENIKMQSMLKALFDFVNIYETEKNLEKYTKKVQSQIMMDEFFNKYMDKQFTKTIEANVEFWDGVIDIETAEQILHSIQSMEYEY